jgi:hypothetical protein
MGYLPQDSICDPSNPVQSDLYEVQVIFYVPLEEEVHGHWIRKSWRPCNGPTSSTKTPIWQFSIWLEYDPWTHFLNLQNCTVPACWGKRSYIKKICPLALSWAAAHKMFTLAFNLSCSVTTWGLSEPHTRHLYLFTYLLMSNAASSEETGYFRQSHPCPHSVTPDKQIFL